MTPGLLSQELKGKHRHLSIFVSVLKKLILKEACGDMGSNRNTTETLGGPLVSTWAR